MAVSCRALVFDQRGRHLVSGNPELASSFVALVGLQVPKTEFSLITNVRSSELMLFLCCTLKLPLDQWPSFEAHGITQLATDRLSRTDPHFCPFWFDLRIHLASFLCLLSFWPESIAALGRFILSLGFPCQIICCSCLFSYCGGVCSKGEYLEMPLVLLEGTVLPTRGAPCTLSLSSVLSTLAFQDAWVEARNNMRELCNRRIL